MEYNHTVILNNYLDFVKGKNISRILDAGSGRTSLGAIVRHFPEADIDAVIYPGDTRKRESVGVVTEAGNYKINLIEKDICKSPFDTGYDLVVAHLLLGETTKFGNTYNTLLEKLMIINFRYLIIIDYLEDPKVDKEAVTRVCSCSNFNILYESYIKNENPQVWPDFTGLHNFGFLIAK